MYRKLSKSPFVGLLLAILLVITSACNLPTGQPSIQGSSGITPVVSASDTAIPAVTVAATPSPIAHKVIPGDPPGSFESRITDPDTSSLASQHRANAGENFAADQFERPFDQSMTYIPDLDIKNADFNRDDTWFYVTISLVGQDPKGGLLGDYGLELDLNMDGRGDYLIMAAAPKATWSTDGVGVWQDANHDVGSTNPIYSDAPTNGDGYETVVFNQGQGADPDTAWARVSPTDPKVVQIAFKRSLIADKSRFLWGAWAIAPEMFHPDWFDYNDHFTIADAGSPLSTSQYYPLKAFYSVDNTCRWAVGFTPTGTEPGICPVPATPTPIPPATIRGLVFDDRNTNGVYDNPPDAPVAGATIRVRSGGCTSPGSVVITGTTNAMGNYSVTVLAGKYCVDVHPDPTISGGWNNKSPSVTVTLSPGGSATANFWYWFLIQ